MKNARYQRTTTGSVVYDPKMQIPESGHLESDVQDGGNVGHSTVDFHLISDSFAH
jgi:hypothetical protein